MWSTVGVTLEGDRRDANERTCSELPLQIVVLRLTVGETEPPTVVVDHDADMIRVVERLCRPFERRVVKPPGGRRRLPDEPRKRRAVLVVPGAATVRGEVVLVPPLELGLRWQWQSVPFAASNQI